MALWVDRHRPATLALLTYHNTLSLHLDRLAQETDLPHLLFFGPSGAGKRTRILATLRALFGSGVDKVKVEHRTLVTPSNRKIDVSLLVSNYHIEINPGDAGTQDRLVVQDLIKEIAQTQNIDQSAAKRFKVVLISDADSLSLPAQHALRRTMEKYMGNLRIILCCTSTAKIIPAVQSRCLLIRVAAPTSTEIASVLGSVATREGFRLADEVAETLAVQSKRNLRRAILMLEALYVTNGSPNRIDANCDLSGIEYDWESYIQELARDVHGEQSAERLALIRPKLYDLIVHCIPPSIILRTLALDIALLMPEVIRPAVLNHAAQYEYSLVQGTKPIFHLEAFVARVMSTYKRFQVQAFVPM
ncbi:putative subunit of DNA replication factor C (RF-C) [Blastocladiella britannica]|nr:putative subunit of DNA replication factor C (RF-C) [Blastocladiella britannica]